MFPSDIAHRADAIGFRTLNWVILASLPALLLGLWAVGHNALGPTDGGITQALILGAGLFVPRLLAAALVGLAWTLLFARLRGRKLDPGWLYCAWLFVLLMPAAIPVWLIVVGLSFGLVFGSLVFGGTGRYFVNPALLGVVFLNFAYPDSMIAYWLPVDDVQTTWSASAKQGFATLGAEGHELLQVVMGREIAALGVASAGGCLVGAIVLVLLRLASWRILAGGLLGMVAVAAAFDAPAWPWQLVLGNFAFALAFVATDPTTTPSSRMGCWVFGLTFGALTVVIRMLNPEHPEGTLFALLLAASVAPLVDQLAKPSIAAGVTE